MNIKLSNATKREKWQAPARLKMILLACGILSSLLYVLTDILASVLWRNYVYASQAVSELIAVNAPTRPYVVVLFIVYALLIFAFGAGVWLSADEKRSIKAAAMFIVAKEIFGVIVTVFFPIHLRGVAGNYSDTMHGILTLMGVFLCMFPAMIAGAAAHRGKFRLYSIVIMILFLVFGVLGGLEQPKYALNLPTPMLGIFERINIYGYMAWIIAFSRTLTSTVEKGELCAQPPRRYHDDTQKQSL